MFDRFVPKQASSSLPVFTEFLSWAWYFCGSSHIFTREQFWEPAPPSATVSHERDAKSLLSKYGRVSSGIKPAVLWSFYKDLTGDSCDRLDWGRNWRESAAHLGHGAWRPKHCHWPGLFELLHTNGLNMTFFGIIVLVYWKSLLALQLMIVGMVKLYILLKLSICKKFQRSSCSLMSRGNTCTISWVVKTTILA